MKEKKHSFLYVLVVIFIIGISFTVGYLMLDKSDMKLSSDSVSDIVSNNWKIEITSDEPNLYESTVNQVIIDKTNIKLSGNLQNQDSEITYTLKIKNNGSIDAYLYSIINSNADLDIKLIENNEELKIGKVLKAGNDMAVTLKIKSKKAESLDFENDLKLVFNQDNN